MTARVAGSRAKPRASLSPERILAAALTLVENGGMPALTTRRLAAALGCQAMSIYHHFPSKQHLVDAIVEQAIAGIREPDAALDPIDKLGFIGREYRAMALRHPRLVHHVALHRLDAPAGVALRERMLPHFHAAIPDQRLAAQAFRIFGHYLIGAVADAASDADATFELGLAMVLTGFAEMRARALASPVPLPKPVIRPKH